MNTMPLFFGDGAFNAMIGDKKVLHLGNGTAINVAVLDKGMTSGLPSVAFGFPMPDGNFLIAETSARLFCSAARAIMAKYQDLFRDN